MKNDTAILVHGVLIYPIEDSTSDNLNGLAELVDLCQEAGLDTNLGTMPTGSAEPGGAPKRSPRICPAWTSRQRPTTPV